jgi:hypothetical protein
MKQIARFTLDVEALAQDPEATHAPLLVDGVRTRYKLEGVSLVDQYETDGGYLIFTDCDCPYEELTFVTLLDQGFKPLHSKMLGPEEGRYRVEVADVWTWRGRRQGVKAVWAPT